MRSRKKLIQLLQKEFGTDDAYSVLASMEHLHQYAILTKTGAVIAILSISSCGAARCGKKFSNMIYNVLTTPRHRGKGYMTALLDFLINDIRSNKKRCLHLEVLKDNRAALHLYKKMGFKTIPVCKGGESVIMRMRL